METNSGTGGSCRWQARQQAIGGEQRYEELTFRELDVLSGLQRRLSNKEIADELSISPLTVKSNARSIYAKLGVNGRRQATARASMLGVIG
jgi:ATP/maltotriose-dependent transcriptional regulator MalT